ncbi:hypothetical protein Acr_00g0048070 [Actinidia rufa]|uniref:Uncharacterized protein n=1 Tax=Actinidia rufa TaxID=165716 RepID=A0A7J0DK55_9ERIC|nr:hypothetical protein Acr_00g0048070 [Actinidia rufa]
MKDTEGDEQEDDWQIRQYIGHEHDEMSAHGFVDQIRGDVPGEDISEQSLIEKACVEASERYYSGGTNKRVPDSHRKRSKEEAKEEVSRRRSQRRDKKNCPRNKAQDQSSEAATTAMMAVDESNVLLAASTDEESDWISNSGIAYHLCRDKEVFSTHVACEGLVRMANDAIVGKGQSGSAWQTGEIHKGDRDEWTKEATVAQRHAKQAQEYLMDVLEGSTVEQERKEMLWDTCRSLARHEKVQPVQDVHEEAQRRETESMHNDRRDIAETSLFRSRYVMVISLVVHTREERWSHDDLQSDGEVELPVEGDNVSRILSCRSYRRAGSEVVGMDNLKTTDYPPMGWRGRLLDPAQLKAQTEEKTEEKKGKKEERKREKLLQLLSKKAAEESKMEAASFPKSSMLNIEDE